jgi:UDP-glucuronate 4-epimerase
MKIIITGACGFIGFHLSKKLLKQNHSILGIDNLNDYYDVSLKENRLTKLRESKKFKFFKFSLNNVREIEEIFKNFKPNIVINLAAQAGVRYSEINPNAYIDSNVLGFLNILKLSLNYQIDKLIYASSSSVYGENSKAPFKENHLLNPISLYGKTKLSNELIAAEFSKLSPIQFIGLRFFTVYGPYGRPDMAYYKFSQKIQKQEKITLFNKGNMSRDMTYIDDIVNGIVLSIDNKNFETRHEIFNLGNTQPISTRDLIKIIERRYKRKALISNKSSENEVFITHADITKSQRVLGYKPVTNIIDGMYNFFEWLDQM